MRLEDKAAAEAWLRTHWPTPIRADGLLLLGQWPQHDAGPPARWRELAALAAGRGLLTPALAALRRGLEEAPDDAGLNSDLSRLLTETGDDAAAAGALDRLRPGSAARLPPLLTSYEAGTLADSSELTGLLLSAPHWTPPHDRMVKAARRSGDAGLGATFAIRWMERHGIAPMAAARAGEALLEAGAAEPAARMLMPLWAANEDTLKAMIGPAHPPPVDGGALAGRIETALRSPAQPPYDLAGAGLAVDAADVLYVGPDITDPHNGIANDIAGHLEGTAAAAGGRLELWLDDALGRPMELRVPDAVIAERIGLLRDHLHSRRPGIVILDCCWSPTGRGLNRDIMAELRRECGFRLVTLFRDALEAAVSLLEYWAEISDGLLIFDPQSPAIAALPGRCTVIPVPALHGPFRPGRNADGLLFMGGLAQTHRVMLLAALAAQSIGLRLVVGAERRRRSSTAQDYASLLGQAAAVLNIATHDHAETLVTGRVWESIACGAVLLEQAGSGTRKFFTPWRHYLPWTHAGDIAAFAGILERRNDLRQAIAGQALDFARRHYPPDRTWRAILAAGLT